HLAGHVGLAAISDGNRACCDRQPDRNRTGRRAVGGDAETGGKVASLAHQPIATARCCAGDRSAARAKAWRVGLPCPEQAAIKSRGQKIDESFDRFQFLVPDRINASRRVHLDVLTGDGDHRKTSDSMSAPMNAKTRSELSSKRQRTP